jgi:surface antigen/uncharacterized protein YraI
VRSVIGGQWLTDAHTLGIPIGSTPAQGAIAVFLPGIGQSGNYGHVAYVLTVSPDGSAVTLLEYNFYFDHFLGPDERTIATQAVSGFIYGGPVPTPSYRPTPVASGTTYQVFGNGGIHGSGSGGLIEYTAPDATSSQTGTLRNADVVTISCQTQTSSVVNGTSIWDKLANGSWISDYWVDTPNAGSFTPSIPRCNVPPPPPPPPNPPPGSGQYRVANAPAGVNLHDGPSTAAAAIGSLPNGAPITIVCQTASQLQGAVVGSSRIWDLLSNNAWLSDVYTTTPVVGGFSPGLTQCPGTAQLLSTPQQPTYVAPAGSQPQAYQVSGTGSTGLFERTGPGTNFSHTGWLANGAPIMIACQVRNDGSPVNGSPMWDLLTDGLFVSDYYTSTPVVGNFSPGLSQCETATQL